MKNYVILLLALMAGNTLNAQNFVKTYDFRTARNYFDLLESTMTYTTNKKENRVKTLDTLKKLMSNQALNIFMAKKVSTYLSGSADLSLYKGYFIVDPTDGKLFVGYNFANDPSDGTTRTKFVHTVGVKANVADAFSTIYKGEDKKVMDDAGLSYKLTLLGRGIIWYDDDSQKLNLTDIKAKLNKKTEDNITQLDILKYERSRFRNTINTLMYKDSMEYINAVKDIGNSDYRNELDSAYFAKKNKEYKEKFITLESDYVDEEEHYNAFWNHWVSLNVFIPGNSTEYKMATGFTDTITSKSLYAYEGTLSWNHLYETKKMRWYGNLTLGLKNLNNIKTEQIEKYSFNDYKRRVTADTSALNLTQIKTSDVYVGNYVSEATGYYSIQIVSLFLNKKKIGLSALLEQYTGNYHPMNLRLGVPFAFKGKDEETKANFELQFRFNDINNAIFPDKSIDEKYTIGISVGIPLTSKIY